MGPGLFSECRSKHSNPRRGHKPQPHPDWETPVWPYLSIGRAALALSGGGNGSRRLGEGSNRVSPNRPQIPEATPLLNSRPLHRLGWGPEKAHGTCQVDPVTAPQVPAMQQQTRTAPRPCPQRHRALCSRAQTHTTAAIARRPQRQAGTATCRYTETGARLHHPTPPRQDV